MSLRSEAIVSHAVVKTNMDFAFVDELLWRFQRAQPGQEQLLTIGGKGSLGSLVELSLAARVYSQVGRLLRISDSDAQVLKLLGGTSVIGSEYGARAGHFPTARRNIENDAVWEHWCMRLQAAAEAVGFPKRLAQGLVGATIELVDNIEEHSEQSGTGLVAYRAENSSVELVIADAGIGVLSSLRKSQVYSGLIDGGVALRLACTDGQTRSSDPRHGYGISQVFRALAGLSGSIRFRSGDHALTIEGDRLSLEGKVVIAQRAQFPGLTVSIRCRAPHWAEPATNLS